MGRFRFWLLPPEKLISQTLLGLGWLLVRPRLWRLLGRLMATAGLPHGIPVSLSLDTHSIWQETFQETFIEGQRDSTPIRLLWPVHFASVLPPAVVGLWSVIYRTSSRSYEDSQNHNLRQDRSQPQERQPFDRSADRAR